MYPSLPPTNLFCDLPSQPKSPLRLDTSRNLRPDTRPAEPTRHQGLHWSYVVETSPPRVDGREQERAATRDPSLRPSSDLYVGSWRNVSGPRDY